MADYTNADVIDARIKAEKYFNFKKKQGISLVRRGELSKKDYYTRIRKVGIDTGIIEPDEYPGVLPDALETVAELALGIPGYMAGFASGGPGGGAVGFGTGSATGQVLFDTANKLFADEDEITKPGSQIAIDAAKQFGVDATLSYGIDKAVVPAVKGSWAYAKGLKAPGKERVNKVFGKLSGKSKEWKNAFVEKYGKAKKESDIVRQTNQANLQREGMTADRYQMMKNDPMGGGILTGAADATGYVPAADIGGTTAFRNQESELLKSLTSRLDPTKIAPGFTGKLEARDPIIRQGVFGRNFLNQLEKGDFRFKTYTPDGQIAADVTKQTDIPLYLVNNLSKIVKTNTTKANQLYGDANAMLKGGQDAIKRKVTPVSAKFSLGETKYVSETGEVLTNPGISATVRELNEQLLNNEGKTGVQRVATELPGFLKKFIQPKPVPFKLTGMSVQKETTQAIPEQLTGKQVFELQQQLRNEIQAKNYFGRTKESMSGAENLNKGFLPSIQKQLNFSIREGDSQISTMLREADEVYKNNIKLLNDNEKLTAYARGIDNTGYNQQVYNDALEGMTRVTGKETSKIPTFSGFGMGKTAPETPEVFNYYLKDASGIQKLKQIMVNNPNLDKAQKLRGEQEYANIMYSQIEDVFDRTLIESLRSNGEFNTLKLLKEIGTGPGAKASDQARFRAIINETKSLKGIKELNKTLKASGVADDKLVPQMQDMTYERLVTFAKAINGFKPLPDVAKFLLRGTILRNSNGATLSKLIPIAGATAGAGAAATMFGLPSALFTIGLLNIFNNFMRSKVGTSYFEQMAKNNSPSNVSKFFTEMFSSPTAKTAISASNYVARATRQASLVGAGQENPVMDAPNQNNYEYYRKVGR